MIRTITRVVLNQAGSQVKHLLSDVRPRVMEDEKVKRDEKTEQVKPANPAKQQAEEQPEQRGHRIGNPIGSDEVPADFYGE